VTSMAASASDLTLGDSPATFATSFPPETQLVAAVRRFVSDFYARVLRDGDSSSRVALATHELLENAVTYCKSGDVTIRVSVSPFRTRYLVRVRTRNAASPRDIANLTRMIHEMEGAPSPRAFFERRMRETMNESSGSGLGLARICAEAGMEIKCTTTGDEVEIAAQTVLGVDNHR
jgi:hypothetical protein